MKTHYFLRADFMPEDRWQEVTVEEFVKAETTAGFRSKFPGWPATGGFSGGGMAGRIRYDQED